MQVQIKSIAISLSAALALLCAPALTFAAAPHAVQPAARPTVQQHAMQHATQHAVQHLGFDHAATDQKVVALTFDADMTLKSVMSSRAAKSRLGTTRMRSRR
jgi:hypothetical protein